MKLKYINCTCSLSLCVGFVGRLRTEDSREIRNSVRKFTEPVG